MKNNLLTESGIVLGDDTIIKEGRILEYARKAKRLYDEKNDRAFFDFIMASAKATDLTEDEKGDLYNTIINEKFSITVLHHSIDVDERIDNYYEGDYSQVILEDGSS